MLNDILLESTSLIDHENVDNFYLSRSQQIKNTEQ